MRAGRGRCEASRSSGDGQDATRCARHAAGFQVWVYRRPDHKAQVKTVKEIDFVERRNAAAASKKRLVEKMQRAPKFDDPALIASRAEKTRLSAANALQRRERDQLRHDADIQQKAEEEAASLAEVQAAKAKVDASAARSATEKAEQKAERDRRYAARKNRSR